MIQLFERILANYSMIRKKQAFLDRFRAEEKFKGNILDELDSAHQITKEVVDEYRAATKANYINYKPNPSY